MTSKASEGYLLFSKIRTSCELSFNKLGMCFKVGLSNLSKNSDMPSVGPLIPETTGLSVGGSSKGSKSFVSY